MNIIRTSANNIYNKQDMPAFKGIPISKIRLKNAPVTDEITIIKLNEKDFSFLDKMIEKLDLESLYPNLKDYKDFKEWKNTIIGTVLNIKSNTIGILGIRQNKPCAIASFAKTSGNRGIYINHLAAWPTVPGEGTKCGGTAMMREIFDIAKNENLEKVFLVPKGITPRKKSCVDFYDKIGLKDDSSGYIKEAVKTDSNNIFSDLCENIDKSLEYKKIHNAQEVDLNNICNKI